MKNKLEFQAMFYTNENERLHIDSEYFNEYPTDESIESLAEKLNSKYVELYSDSYNDESYSKLLESLTL
jgi:hypothetical protein